MSNLKTKKVTTFGRIGRLGLVAAMTTTGMFAIAAAPAQAVVAKVAAPQVCTTDLGAVTVTDGLRVPAGAHCNLTGTTVTGDIIVEADGWLTASKAVVNDNVVATNALGVSFTESTLKKNVTANADGTNWEVGYLYLIDSTVNGSVAVVGDALNGGVDLELSGTTVTGGVNSNKANYTDLSKVTIGGNLSISGNDFGAYLCQVSVVGDATLSDNGYEVAAFANTPNAACGNISTVGGKLQITGNKADVTVGLVTVTGNINLGENTPKAVFASGASYCGEVVGEYTGKDPFVNTCDNGAEAKDWSHYQKVLLTKNTGEPIDLAILPDGKILHTARNGAIRLTDPAQGTTSIINTIPVYANSEDGLQTIGIDPDFATNKWVYVYYAPKLSTPAGSAPTTLPTGADEATYWKQWEGVNRLSRFKWTGSALDLTSEQTVIEVPVQRGQCCHVGGDFGFDDKGNLYLATGDNTPADAPGAGGYAPNNDAPRVNPGMDDRRGAGNTNDLRGKILRIKPNATTAGYTVPTGNLFPAGTAKTKPEIFVMGVRNPFRMDVDVETNSLSWGDYGPDAGNASATRGPMGLVEWNTTGLDNPHNSGWPYCVADNKPYNEWNFATATQGPWFDCANLKNNSRWNTGLVDIPPSRPATLWYGDNPGQQPWNELVNFGSGGGQGPMGGPVYHYDADNPSGLKFPPYWDRKAFFGEFSQDYLAVFTTDWPNGPVSKIEDFLPNSALTAQSMPIHDNPMDMEFGPDGALYVLEYGDGFFTENPDAGLYQISYTQGNQAPVAAFTATPISSSSAPLTVNFNASASADPEGEALTYQWDFDGNGTYDATGVTASYTYTTLGQFTARLKVTDPQGRTGLISKKITVGNVAPEVSIDLPGDGSFFDWGKAVPFKVSTTDAEDGTDTVCSKVTWEFGLGHAEHAHPLTNGTGCTGAWPTPVDAPEHGETEKIYGGVVVRYTDKGNNGLPGAEGETQITLNPKLQQAEHATERKGVSVIFDAAANGTGAITGLGANDYLRYAPVNFAGITGVKLTAKGTGNLQLRFGSATAAPFATIAVSSTTTWQNVNHTFATAPTGSGQLFVTSNDELSVDALTFLGNGVDDVINPTVTHTLNPATGTGTGGAYTGPVALTLDATDNGTIASVQYSTNNGTSWITVSPTAGKYVVNFTTGGVRNLLYRATDNGGNVGTGSVNFTIDLPTCDPSDEFDGTSLNTTCRWTTIVGSNPANVSVSGGELKIVTENGEFNNARVDGKNLILQDAPAGDWTIEMKLKAAMTQQYQQAMLMAYNSNDNFIKSGVAANNLPAAATVFYAETVAETNGAFGTGGNRQYQLPAGTSTGDWYVKLVKTGNNYEGFVSVNGTVWNSMGAPVTHATPMTKIGLHILGPVQAAAVTVPIDYFRVTTTGAPADVTAPTTSGTVSAANPAIVTLTATDAGSGVKEIKYRLGTTGAYLTYTAPVSVPKTSAAQTLEYYAVDNAGNQAANKTLTIPAADSSCLPADRGPNDQFNAAALDTCRWTLVNGNPATGSIVNGAWTVQTANADIYQTSNGVIPNIITTTQPAGTSWVIETKVKIDTALMYQQGGIIVMKDVDNFVRLSAQARANNGSVYIDLGSELAAVNAGNSRTLELPQTADDTYWLRLTRNGNVYSGSYSLNGTTWVNLATPWTNAAVATAEVGLYALGANAATQTTASFDYIVQRASAAPTTSATVTPAAPTGTNGWYTGPVTVAVTATGQLPGAVTTEVQIDGGAWTAYTAPVVVSADGNHTVGYRSTQDGQTAAVKTVTFKIDTAKPTVTGTAAPVPPTAGWNTSNVTVTAAATDALDTAPSIQSSINGGPWVAYTAPIVVSTDGTHEVKLRATDAAGNVSDVVTKLVKIDRIAPITAPLIEGLEEGSTEATITLVASDSASGVTSSEYKVGNGPWVPYEDTFSIARQATAQQFSFRSTDVAGNVEQIRTVSIPGTTSAEPKPSTTALTVTTPTVVVGGKVTVKATVTSTGNLTSGFVVIHDGEELVGGGTLTNGSVTVVLSGLTAGTHELTATFVGNSAAAASTSAKATATVNFADYVSGAFHTEVLWLASQGITTGNAQGQFQPAEAITRQAMAAMLFRASNPGAELPACTVKPFTDVPLDNPFCGAIKWMKDKGITTGNTDGTFAPGAKVQRQATAAFLYRWTHDNAALPTCTTKPFPDVPVDNEFCGAIKWLVDAGIATGWDDGTFRRAASVERQAFAAFLYRIAHPAV